MDEQNAAPVYEAPVLIELGAFTEETLGLGGVGFDVYGQKGLYG
jgi:hypothetical protein